jgi:hypothetical protein
LNQQIRRANQALLLRYMNSPIHKILMLLRLMNANKPRERPNKLSAKKEEMKNNETVPITYTK